MIFFRIRVRGQNISLSVWERIEGHGTHLIETFHYVDWNEAIESLIPVWLKS